MAGPASGAILRNPPVLAGYRWRMIREGVSQPASDAISQRVQRARSGTSAPPRRLRFGKASLGEDIPPRLKGGAARTASYRCPSRGQAQMVPRGTAVERPVPVQGLESRKGTRPVGAPHGRDWLTKVTPPNELAVTRAPVAK